MEEAMQSGDEATNNLRKQLANLQDEFDAFKVKAKNDFDGMKESLTSTHRKELADLKQKYEQMLAELKANASNDKEFMQNELRRKIKALEDELAEVRKSGDASIEQLKAQHREKVAELEAQM